MDTPYIVALALVIIAALILIVSAISKKTRKTNVDALIKAHIKADHVELDDVSKAIAEMNRDMTGAYDVTDATNPLTGKTHIRKTANLDAQGTPVERGEVEDKEGSFDTAQLNTVDLKNTQQLMIGYDEKIVDDTAHLDRKTRKLLKRKDLPGLLKRVQTLPKEQRTFVLLQAAKLAGRHEQDNTSDILLEAAFYWEDALQAQVEPNVNFSQPAFLDGRSLKVHGKEALQIWAVHSEKDTEKQQKLVEQVQTPVTEDGLLILAQIPVNINNLIELSENNNSSVTEELAWLSWSFAESPDEAATKKLAETALETKNTKNKNILVNIVETEAEKNQKTDLIWEVTTKAAAIYPEETRFTEILKKL